MKIKEATKVVSKFDNVNIVVCMNVSDTFTDIADEQTRPYGEIGSRLWFINKYYSDLVYSVTPNVEARQDDK